MRHAPEASYHDEAVIVRAPETRERNGHQPNGHRAADRAIPRAARVLVMVIGVLVAASLGTRVLASLLESSAPESSLTAMLLALSEMFDVNGEANIPSWFSSGLLLTTALLTAMVAVLVRQAGRPYTAHWFGLALLFAYLSLDETAELHERLSAPMAALLGEGARGPLRFAWVLPAIAVAAALGLTYLRFLAHLPVVVRHLLRAAAVLFLTGAVGMEMAGGIALDDLGNWTLYTLVNTVEETMEMLGSVTFLCAVLGLVRLERGPTGYRLQLRA